MSSASQGKLFNPLPSVEYTFRYLPWRWRLRRFIRDTDFRKDFPEWDEADTLSAKTELDRTLDRIFWESHNVYARIRAVLNGYIASPEKSDSMKGLMLSVAIDDTFSGHTRSLDSVPRWPVFAARVSKAINGEIELVLFAAEGNEMAIDIVLNEMVRMDELRDSQPDYVWGLVALFYKKDGKYYEPPVDNDLTSAFWDKARGLMPRTTI